MCSRLHPASRDVERTIAAIRGSHPDIEWLYMEGQCYNFFLMLRSIWPSARAFYSMSEGHVYTKINGNLFDIRGRHLKAPRDLAFLDHSRGDKPHRWGARDKRALLDTSRKIRTY
jgi:hypothetical protein